MAEFQEVLKQARRMCAAQYHCHGCPLHEIIYANACNKPLSCMAAVRGDMIETLERIVTEWAANHPEPVVPMWIDANCTLPDENEGNVLVIANGQWENIKFVDAVLLGTYYYGEGWVIEGYETWADPEVSWWRPLPDKPEVRK